MPCVYFENDLLCSCNLWTQLREKPVFAKHDSNPTLCRVAQNNNLNRGVYHVQHEVKVLSTQQLHLSLDWNHCKEACFLPGSACATACKLAISGVYLSLYLWAVSLYTLCLPTALEFASCSMCVYWLNGSTICVVACHSRIHFKPARTVGETCSRNHK